MPKTKQSKRRKRFDYNQDRKKLKKKFINKYRPSIESQQIRAAWNNRRSVARNLQDMGLVLDVNAALPVKKSSLLRNDRETSASVAVVTKPYVIKQLEEEAGQALRDTKTLSSDLVEFVQHMIREHNDDYKAMARDEKNYYQDTPTQIRRKINEYKRCHLQDYHAFISSLAAAQPTHTC
ncbi:hypothetical protein JOB18_043246 [Solea senegalensis]|uniref:Nucleolar protein 16 n=1 Tax=Solea senegalensis TaxID=28829 RepID=A0AAV6SJ00_SOLSE|nr:nucleolar protein 16 [Solea senegalensis]KAG7516898.1 hypothetical protein JOB18_043246 [Solea senegalensis]